jgi:class 3 adenylate cyclase
MGAADFQSWAQENQWNDYPAVALVFTDTVGSTTLLYEVGDDTYDTILTAHLDRARRLISALHGREINSTGDGILCAFLKVEDAVRFASQLFASPGSDRIQIRAGIHFGQLKIRAMDFCGKNVHFASRVMSQAAGPEIWLSDTARQRLEQEAPALLRGLSLVPRTHCVLKNVPGEHTLWHWQLPAGGSA